MGPPGLTRACDLPKSPETKLGEGGNEGKINGPHLATASLNNESSKQRVLREVA